MPQIRCNVCNAKFHQQENAVGKFVQCPKCYTRIKIKNRDEDGPSQYLRRRPVWQSYAIGFVFGLLVVAIAWALFATQ